MFFLPHILGSGARDRFPHCAVPEADAQGPEEERHHANAERFPQPGGSFFFFLGRTVWSDDLFHCFNLRESRRKKPFMIFTLLGRRIGWAYHTKSVDFN